MLSNTEIIKLSYMLNKDIKTLNLSRTQIPEQISYYLENIAGLECITPKQHQEFIQRILDQAKVYSP